MATVIRAQISEKNKYYLDKHRHYELKHFCLQYPEWKRSYAEIDNVGIAVGSFNRMPTGNLPGDPTARRALTKARLVERIGLIERIAKEADEYLYDTY